MTALEQQVKRPGTLPGGVQIVGTDISSTMLNQCKEGSTTAWRWPGLSRAQATVFEPCGDNKMRVVERVRKLTSFRPLNLLESYSLLGKFDIIFCRNVLIYFAPEVKSKILNQFASSLNPGGYLMLGASGVSGRPHRQVRDDPLQPRHRLQGQITPLNTLLAHLLLNIHEAGGVLWQFHSTRHSVFISTR